jgi:hypothetical protein
VPLSLTLEVCYVSSVWSLHIALYKSLFLLVFSFVGGGLGAVFCRLGGFMGQSLRIF